MGETVAASDEASSFRGLGRDPSLVGLALASYVGMFNATVVSPALPSIAAAFALSDVEVGLVMSVYTVPGIVFVLVVGTFADIYGRRTFLVASLTVYAVAGVAIALVDSFGAVLALRIVQGIGAAALMPLVSALIGDLFEGTVRSTAHGIRASVNGVSMLAMPIVVGAVVTFSWRYAFALYGLAFVGLAAVVRYVPETDSRADDGVSLRSSVIRSVANTLGEVRGGQQGLMVLGGLVRGFSMFALLTFVPLFADRSLAATAAAVGVVIAMRGAARVFVAPLAGPVIGRLSHRTVMTVAMLLSAASAFAVPFSPSVFVLGVLVGTYSVGDSLFFPAYQDALTATATPEQRASVLSAASLLRKVGIAVSPVLYGAILASTGFATIFVSVAALLVGYAVLLVLYTDI